LNERKALLRKSTFAMVFAKLLGMLPRFPNKSSFNQ